MAAADRISTWIAVFIDEELAGRALEHLKAEIGKSTSPFREMNDDDRRIVRNFTKRASLEDIVKGKEETIFKPALQCNRRDIPLFQMNG